MDLTGKTFGHLQVVGRDYNNKKSGIYWMCICDCQLKERVPKQRSIRQDKLLEGRTTSCGCCKLNQKTRGSQNTNKFDLDSEEYGIGYTYDREKFIFDKEDYDKIVKISTCWNFNDGGYLQTRDKSNPERYPNNKRKMVKLKDVIMDKIENHEIVKYKTKNKNDNRKSNLIKIQIK